MCTNNISLSEVKNMTKTYRINTYHNIVMYRGVKFVRFIYFFCIIVTFPIACYICCSLLCVLQ